MEIQDVSTASASTQMPAQPAPTPGVDDIEQGYETAPPSEVQTDKEVRNGHYQETRNPEPNKGQTVDTYA
jgi:hypothetical protein